MEFLEKLDYLMLQQGLNKSTLSKSCDIPYTTIDNWYKRGYDGLKLTTLRKLSDYFGISLDDWTRDDIQSDICYSPKEKEIIKSYRSHPEVQYCVDKLLDINVNTSKESN